MDHFHIFFSFQNFILEGIRFSGIDVRLDKCQERKSRKQMDTALSSFFDVFLEGVAARFF